MATDDDNDDDDADDDDDDHDDGNDNGNGTDTGNGDGDCNGGGHVDGGCDDYAYDDATSNALGVRRRFMSPSSRCLNRPTNRLKLRSHVLLQSQNPVSFSILFCIPTLCYFLVLIEMQGR